MIFIFSCYEIFLLLSHYRVWLVWDFVSALYDGAFDEWKVSTDAAFDRSCNVCVSSDVLEESTREGDRTEVRIVHLCDLLVIC